MADVRDWGKFIRGRWDWTRHGYETGFPRGCQFTDVDATVEFDGRALVIEPKHYEGLGLVPSPYSNTGQMLYLRSEAQLGKVVLMLFGCGPCNDPYAVLRVGKTRSEDVAHQWRDEHGQWLPKGERRQRLKRLIDEAMGIVQPAALDLDADDWPPVREPGAAA